MVSEKVDRQVHGILKVFSVKYSKLRCYSFIYTLCLYKVLITPQVYLGVTWRQGCTLSYEFSPRL